MITHISDGGGTGTRTQTALNTQESLAGSWDTITPYLQIIWEKQRQEKQVNNFTLDIINLDVKETSGKFFCFYTF